MANPTELDIITRSLSGDRRARTELYKKFVHGSSRVRRLGTGYSDIDDFLQDTFSNLLRTGHSWDKETSLGLWVENVAVWTALQKDRQRGIAARNDGGVLRMCAEFEGEDGGKTEVLKSYAPPMADYTDSPRGRMLELLTDTERAVLTKQAVDKAGWEDTAAAAEKPVSTVGPIFTRVVSRLARLFGAPPPMDDDLVPVFERVAAKPGVPEGRAISIQLDTVFYAMTPETRKIGLNTSYDIRLVTLWEASELGAVLTDRLEKHLGDCHYCTDLLRALGILRRALLSPKGADFLLCPGSFTLAESSDESRATLGDHLAHCKECREERARVREGRGPLTRPAAETGAGSDPHPGAGKKIAVVAVALLLLAVGSFGGYRYWVRGEARRDAPSAPVATEQQQTISIDPKYADLVQVVPFDDDRILNSAFPKNRPSIKWMVDKFRIGEIPAVLAASSQAVQSQSTDPAVRMIYAMSLRQTGWATDAYREMLKSEALSPRETFRCWIMFNFALVAGDRKVMDREAEHLESDPKYGPQVKKTMEKVRAR
jgi:DNA-directed RNA polymerase specialized sigma24 family protein